MTLLKTFGEIVLPIFAVLGGIWAFFKLFYRFKSKFLFITNCQLLNRDIWGDISKHYKIKQNGTMDHAFRPLVLLPHSLKKYSNIKNGHKAVLESINPNRETRLKIVAEVYWIPEDMKPWNTINHPVFSLVLRRYFGIEMPMYQDEKIEDIKDGWKLIRHNATHLFALNRALDKDNLQW